MTATTTTNTTVAVAGGTKGLGLTIAEALAIHGKHNVVILSRKSTPSLDEKLPARLVVVDYDNVQNLTEALEENKVSDVICTINAYGSSLPERNLIRAAENSSTTKRFIPSIFAGFAYPTKLVSRGRQIQNRGARGTGEDILIHTAVYNGMFMDFYGSPLLKSNVGFFPMFVDIANNVAAKPGSGDQAVVLTRVLDIARFVVRILDLAVWPKESYFIGDRVTIHDFVNMAEEARGTKFRITYDSKEELEAGQVTELPCYETTFAVVGKEMTKQLFAQTGLWIIGNELDLRPVSTLNETFPDIKTMTLRRFLELSWKV
ncbi:NmrA-like family protein [Aspergillus eucalypticola CBS 122712]|uniref:NmrA-like family protein n=1 Tax=Aspergillus eucalypticola (strain CBS 122712 / IBT 29274) TaxID=1448314 RepID=A0A317V3L2_ASPEC|nr:NmrA-like family protein [Aspergillus eucalypticola CBS 122712]PWY67392.1 NmrA-like family protein [Aspergillus eucalypticola CBS 122712]